MLDVDVDKERISLGIKQLGEDPFGEAIEGMKKGEVVTGTVTQVLDNGIEVDLGGGMISFIRKAELSRDRSEQRPSRFAVGERIDGRITAIDKKSRKVTLSIKQKEIQEEKQAMADYGSSDSGASLGDILGAAISKAAEERAALDDDEDAPTEEASAEEASVEEAPAEEAPAEEASVEEAPAEKASEEPAEQAEAAKPKAAKKKATKAKAEKDEATEAASEDTSEGESEAAEAAGKKTSEESASEADSKA